MFPLDQEMEELEHLAKALLLLCQETEVIMLITPEGRDEIGTAGRQWERSSLEKPLRATWDLLPPPALSPASILHSRRIFSSCPPLFGLISCAVSAGLEGETPAHVEHLEQGDHTRLLHTITSCTHKRLWEKNFTGKTNLRQSKADFFTWRTQGGSKTPLLP